MELLTLNEAAKFLTVKESWLRSAVFRGEIKPIKLGRLVRFKKESLIKFLESKMEIEIDIQSDLNESKNEER